MFQLLYVCKMYTKKYNFEKVIPQLILKHQCIMDRKSATTFLCNMITIMVVEIHAAMTRCVYCYQLLLLRYLFMADMLVFKKLLTWYQKWCTWIFEPRTTLSQELLLQSQANTLELIIHQHTHHLLNSCWMQYFLACSGQFWMEWSEIADVRENLIRNLLGCDILWMFV